MNMLRDFVLPVVLIIALVSLGLTECAAQGPYGGVSIAKRVNPGWGSNWKGTLPTRLYAGYEWSIQDKLHIGVEVVHQSNLLTGPPLGYEEESYYDGVGLRFEYRP